MSEPLVSVIIPTYKGERYILEAIESVCSQTYPKWELIIVDDGSPDSTEEVVARCCDRRIRYIRHERNLGAYAAWRTGLATASGEVIGCLDQDDAYHPEKLRMHVALRERQPEVGLSYNGRFETGPELSDVRQIWQPPSELSLRDLTMGFPFAPSDMILDRRWALHPDVWDDSSCAAGVQEIIANGGEYVYCCRLYFAGCVFAGISRALNYRRHDCRRHLKDLSLRCDSEIACQAVIFDDLRFPGESGRDRSRAYRNTYLSFATFASWQGEWELATRFLAEAIRLDSSLTLGDPPELAVRLSDASTAEDSLDHVDLLHGMFRSLPAGLNWPAQRLNWAIGRGFVQKTARALLWMRQEQCSELMRQARQCKPQWDVALSAQLATELYAYRREFGAEAASGALDRWRTPLSELCGVELFRDIAARYWARSAFEYYQEGRFSHVPNLVLRAMWNDTKYARNRGMISITARSLAGMVRAAVAG